jgi:hypothetical protein
MESAMSQNENQRSNGQRQQQGSGQQRGSEHQGNSQSQYQPESQSPSVPQVETFTFAITGNQTAQVEGISASHGPEQFLQFNPIGGDVLNLANVVNGSAATLATLGNYITATTSAAGDTTLSFDATGTAFAVLKGVSITVPQLLADNALSLGTAVSPAVPEVETFTFAVTGNQTAQVEGISASHGPEQFLQFNPIGGDVLNLANVVKGSAATLATLGNYITATTSVAGDTTLSFDATGTGLAGTAFAVLKGVSITVPQLLADNALSLGTAVSPAVPQVETFTFAITGNQTTQVEGISVSHGPEQFLQFNPTGGDVLNLANVVKGSAATLATLGNYITATTSVAGDTTLSFDATGTGLAGTAFAVLKGVSITVPQLLADNALSLGAAAPAVSPPVPQVDIFTFAAAGNQTAVVDAITASEGPEQIVQFNPTIGDVLNLTNVVKGSAATLATLGNYITATTSAAGDTTLSYDATGTGLVGTAFAVLKGVSITVPQLLADNALAIAAPTSSTPSGTTHVTLAQNNAVLTYGNGNYNISVTGTGENITVGNGNSEISGPQGSSTVTTGTGHQDIFLTGTNNVITVGDNTTTSVTEIFAGTGSDHVTAGAGPVYIVGSGSSDTIVVGNGNDTIVETAHGATTVGINSVTLGNGNDAVFLGGTGNSVVLGSGADRVVGGTGHDTFVVNAAGGTDTISNFSLTNGDTLDLTKILSTATLAHDLSNLGSFVTLTSVVDTAVSTGLDTKLTITGGGSASVTLLNSGPMALTDLVSHSSLVLPPH